MSTTSDHTTKNWRRGLACLALAGAILLPATMAHAAGPHRGSAGHYTATLPTKLEHVHAFPAPPAGFDPLKASAEELEQYGLPLPPDATTNAVQYQRWVHLMHAATHYVRPVFTAHLTRRHHLRLSNNNTSNNWSGTVVTDPTGSFRAVQGTWVVPSVDSSSPGTLSSAWVGLDGWGNSQVEQLGTEQKVDSYGRPTYYAWVELYSPQCCPETQTNLEVQPGDNIYAYMSYDPSANQVYFYMENETTGGYLSFTVPATYGAPGVSAEWIMEAPQLGGATTSLANFGYVELTNGYVWSPSTGWVPMNNNPFNPTQLDMVGASGYYLDNTTVLDDATDGIQWAGYN